MEENDETNLEELRLQLQKEGINVSVPIEHSQLSQDYVA